MGDAALNPRPTEIYAGCDYMNNAKRTDLAAEQSELYKERTGADPEGVESANYERDGIVVTKVTVKNELGAAALGKPVGTYVTVELAEMVRREQDGFARAAAAVAAELSGLLNLKEGESVMVAGLGNRSITPDAIGPKAVEYTMVTRHLVERLPETFGSFRKVSAISPGVLGITGVETGEIIKGVLEKTVPDRLVVIDALASRRLSRLCNTIQIADTGITPGSGVGNSRGAVNREALGLPVIAIGVPTVVDAATMAADMMDDVKLPESEKNAVAERFVGMMVTPKEIDAQVADISKLIGYGINLALHEGISLADIDMFVS